ncbi:MAG: sialidase family protein [Planctomycetota bacterium]
MWHVEPIAQDHVEVFRSPDPQAMFCYSPGILRLDSGRLVATMDLGGPGVAELPGPKRGADNGAKAWQGKVFVSDDHGSTWRHVVDFPFIHARPFVAGNRIYVLGHDGRLMIIASDDQGETWTAPTNLTEGDVWHQAPANVWHTRDNIYLVMENRPASDVQGWNVTAMAPVLMRGPEAEDLTRPEAWTFASSMVFRDVVPIDELDWFGVPFYQGPGNRTVKIADGGRNFAPIGWLETNVVQFPDPEHIWHDPTGRTFHLFARAHTGRTGYAALCKVVEHEDGSMETGLVTAPSGRRMLYTPMPGGQMKFHVLYDEVDGLYWLLSTQSTDSMRRPEALPKGRYGLPDNERRRLTLHFSRNMIDWCFAALVAVGPVEHGSRHYASMTFDGDDLHVLSRSGDAEARTAHDGNIITFHTVKDFRRLVY